MGEGSEQLMMSTWVGVGLGVGLRVRVRVGVGVRLRVRARARVRVRVRTRVRVRVRVRVRGEQPMLRTLMRQPRQRRAVLSVPERLVSRWRKRTFAMRSWVGLGLGLG